MEGSRDFLDDLNDQQREAVRRVQGPTLVLAGAGSGKTRTITYKVAHLIRRDICRPENILAVTFTNKAADEMRGRVEGLLQQLTSAPLVCTFHSFAVRILRRQAPLVGYGSDFAICDADDQKRVLKSIYGELQLTDSQLPLSKTRSLISYAKSRNWNPEKYLENSRDFDAQQIARVFRAYQEFLVRSNAMDFDDLILMAVKLLRENREVRERHGEWYRYLLIDEYQDTNRPQYDLIRALTAVHQNLTAVGDEDQSIYGFRGADIGNILRFEKDFPGALIVKLEQNYRSTQIILDAATGVVSHNIHRKGKVLWTEASAGEPIELYAAPDARMEALYVSQRIYRHVQAGDAGLAVLYRTNFQSRQFEEALRRLDISYRVIGGVSFYQRREIRDALAYLRVAQQPEDDVALLRILNQPPRGIGQVTLENWQRLAGRQKSSLWRALEQGLSENQFPARAHLALEGVFQLIQQCQQFGKLPLHLGLEKILEASGYIQALREEDREQAHNRILNLEELITVAREHGDGGGTLQDFLDQASLRSEADDYDASAPVSLMTLHNAKGLEFDIVFLVGCEEGLFPHSRAVAEDDLEEERRLCYVGLSRARKRLYLIYSQRRRFYGRDTDEQNLPSRFLSEIPTHLIHNYWDRVQGTGPAGGDRPAPRARAGKPFAGKTYDSSDSARNFLEQLSRKNKSQHGFVSGARILHPQYGQGQILQVQETGDDLKITVRFPTLGIKKMLQRYAKLKLV